MILIDGVLVEEDLIHKKFCCDLKKCKGACCTFYGEFGAPVLDSEVELMEECKTFAEKYLSEQSKSYIIKHGVVEGIAGNYTTVCMNKKDCVFVYYEDDIAFCALEKAYLSGATNFRKPLSCHLFPVRVAYWSNGHLYFSEIPECDSAVKKGKKEDIFLYYTVKEALIRKFGKSWYENFVNYSKFSINKS
ncbi:DUF3109 family protein [Bacteroidota bacterium]